MGARGDAGPGNAAVFARRWILEREISHTDGLKGVFSGHAVIAAAGPGTFIYDEEGRLQLGQAEPLVATRRYVWKASGQGVNVFFADGRPFHRIDLSGPGTATVHTCPPDRYAVAYDFSAWPDWTATWDVEGPRKSYRMVSRYFPS